MAQPRSTSSCESENTETKKVKGVELLENLERFVIQRKIDPFEKWYSPNTYNISSDEKSMSTILMAKEEDADKMFLRSVLCCNQRKFDMRLVDVNGDTVMWLEHPSSCNWPIMCPSCRPGMVVRSSSGRILGYVEHAPRDTCGSWLPPSLYYDVMDSDGQSLLKIEGPACKMEFCSTTAFRIYSSKYNSYIGEIGHEWQGTCDGIFSCCVTDQADKTTITFPRDINVVEKALLLGTVMLTHINYFEHV